MTREVSELSRMEKKLLSLQQELQREKELASCTRALLSQLPSNQVLVKFLYHLRNASEADQVSYIENFDDPSEGLCMKLIQLVRFSEGNNKLDKTKKPWTLPYSSVSSKMFDNLSSDKSYGGNVSSLPERTLDELVGNGVLSLEILPIFVNERFHGFIEFKYLQENGKWSRKLIKQLKVCTRRLSVFFERQLAEEKLIRQKEELSEFARAMSHDIGNSLLAIKGYCELLEVNYDPKYLEQVDSIVDTLSKMLTRSVELADAGLVIEKSEDIDLTDIVHEVAKLTVPSSIAFICGELLTVSGDRDKLTQVFQNLFTNAVKHGKPGRIVIKTRKYRSGSRLYIKNNGKPISLDDAKKIFNHGFTTNRESSGLGLAIVKKIVEAHGWKIDLVKSTETTFRIIIPRKKIFDQLDNGKPTSSNATQG